MSGQAIGGIVGLVTGANRGIGRAIVEALLERGARKVYAGARNAGKIVVTPPGARINNFSTEPRDMAWQEGWSQVADFILAAYQTPKAITGMTAARHTAANASKPLGSLLPGEGKMGLK